MKRINIGMTFYGGVSLAVYEAGVAEEFLRFVQFCKGDGKKYLGDEISDVDVRVISGTSAGGLAAALMSATLVNADDPTQHIKEMRRIWFDVADLSRIQYKAGQNITSLLNNDILEDEIIEFLRIGDGATGMCKDVKILVTATNMQGFFDAIPVEHDFAGAEGHADRAFSTMRHTEVFEFTGCQIREAGTRQGKEIRRRIAQAARITSSFPAAFPPQFVQSPSFPEKTIAWYTNSRGKKGKPLHFWYFDGGVLDNKPLGHAIDHMQSSREEGLWWYFFVEPKPQDYRRKHEEWGVKPQNPPDPSATVMAVFEARGAETIYYDLRRVQKINHQIMQINDFVSSLWSNLKDCHDITLLQQLENNLRTARIHRFLADYLKCVTMIRYDFVGKDNISPERKQELDDLIQCVITAIRPLDLPRIISEIALDEAVTKIVSQEVINTIRSDPELLESLETFEKSAGDVREAQLLFRQITFWVEKDYIEKNDLSERTWKSFTEAKAELTEALQELNSNYEHVLQRIQALLDNDDLLNSIKCYTMLNEAVHATAGIETREKINVIKIYHNPEKGPLAGAKLANFAGFLDRRWRKHDYLMGIKDTREMLKGKLKKTIQNDSFWNAYDEWHTETARELNKETDEQYWLDQDDILSFDDKMLENLPAGNVLSQTSRILRTSGKLIRKYDDRFFFSLLKLVKIHLILPVIRFILWLLSQATIQPSQAKKKGIITSLKNFFVQGRRYLGFLLIGVVVGILISFFLPDFVGNSARWIMEKVTSFFTR